MREKYLCKNLEVEEGGRHLLEGGIFWELTVLVLYPGDFLNFTVNSEEANALPCKLANEIALHQKHIIIDCSTIDTANLAPTRMCSVVNRPFSL